MDESIEKYMNASRVCDEWSKAFVDERCLDRRFRRVPLHEVIDAIIAGKSALGVNEPANDGEFGVLKVSAVGSKGFNALEHKRLIHPEDFIPRFAVTTGDFLITRCNAKELVGRVCIVPNSHPSLMLCDKTLKLVFADGKVEPGFIEAIMRCRDLRVQIEARATGTGGAMKNISQDDIRSLVVPLPTAEEQRNLLQELQRVLALKMSYDVVAETAVKLQAGIINGIVEQNL